MDIDWCAGSLFELARDIHRSGRIQPHHVETMVLESGLCISCLDTDGERLCFNHVWKYPDGDAKLRFKLCMMELLLDKYTESVLEYLLHNAADMGKDNLLAVFSMLHRLTTRHSVFDKRILQRCRTYFHLDYLRPVISRILASFSSDRMDLVLETFGEEEVRRMHLWNPKDLETDSIHSREVVERLFQTINERSFKQSKRILRQIDERLFALLPDAFSNTGYSHLRELFCGLSPERCRAISRSLGERSTARLFLPLEMDGVDEEYFTHECIEVRVEAFRHIRSTEEIRRFLSVNQFIYNRGSLRRLAGHFHVFVRGSKGRKVELQTLYSEVIVFMINSRNVARRLLGCLLMDVLLRENIIPLPECSHLLFDQSHEIRKIAGEYSGEMVLEEEYVVEKIESNRYCDIYGGTEYIKSHQSEGVLAILKTALDDLVGRLGGNGRPGGEDIPVYGHLHLFSTLGRHNTSAEVDVVYRHSFEKLTDMNSYDEENTVIPWRNLRECCAYYHKEILGGNIADPLDRLVQVLLNVNHLGAILLTSRYLSDILEKIELADTELFRMIDMCFERIRCCTVVFRKSGGMGLVLAAVIRRNPRIFGCVLDRLFRYMDEESHTMLHCLNVLSRFIEDSRICLLLSPHTTRLFSIALDCNRSSCWSIRNVGTEMVTKLVTRVFGSLQHIDRCFLIHRGLRDLFYNTLESSRADGNNLLIFSILHIYERVERLDERELATVGSCLERGGLVALKARDIIDGACHASKTVGAVMRFSEGLGEGEILSRALILLDSEHEEERRMVTSYITDVLGCTPSSREYLKHQLVRRICRLGYSEVSIEKLRRYNSATEVSLSCIFDSSPANEYFDLEYNLGLFDSYKDH